MPADQLHITLIQADIAWEDKAANLLQYERYLESITARKELIVMHEMFNTVFTMNAAALL